MSTQLLRPYVPYMIESFEQGLCDKHPELVQLVTDKIMEQYDRIVGTDHSGCVIFETGDLTDKNPYNVVIQALYNQMTNWYGGEEVITGPLHSSEERGFVLNFRECRGIGKAIGFLVHMVPMRGVVIYKEEANYFLILHSQEDSTMLAIEEGGAASYNERIMFEREFANNPTTFDIETRPFLDLGRYVPNDTMALHRMPQNSVLYETTPSHPLPIETEEGGPITSTESLNDR